MSQQYTTPQLPSHFVNVKRVKQDKDNKGREKTVFTIGIGKDKAGNEVNNLDVLIDTLTQYRGRQVNLDFRVEEKADQNGRTFPSAFLRVVEMVPKNATPNGTTATYTPKTNTRQAAVKANAEKIRKDFGG